MSDLEKQSTASTRVSSRRHRAIVCLRHLSADGWSAYDAHVIFVTLEVGSPLRRVAQNLDEIAAIRQDLTCRVTLVNFERRHSRAGFVRQS